MLLRELLLRLGYELLLAVPFVLCCRGLISRTNGLLVCEAVKDTERKRAPSEDLRVAVLVRRHEHLNGSKQGGLTFTPVDEEAIAGRRECKEVGFPCINALDTREMLLDGVERVREGDVTGYELQQFGGWVSLKVSFLLGGDRTLAESRTSTK